MHNSILMIKKPVQHLKYDLKIFLGAITFYTIIPLSSRWKDFFQQLAR
jgi:hypothetical protein